MDILKHWHSDPAKLHLLKNGMFNLISYSYICTSILTVTNAIIMNRL